MVMEPGTVVVFEGLDKTGKSTQMERFERSVHAPDLGDSLISPAPMFTHQPSGATGIGPEIYDLTEKVDWRKSSPLTRQLLHLAAHSEHYAHDIIPRLETSAVWMDRCWWSTVAYGWRGEVREMFEGNQHKTGLSQFVDIAQLPTRGVMPHVVFLFLEQYGTDELAHSDKVTRRNYERLARRYPDTTVMVPRLGKGETTAFIAGELKKRNLLKIKELKS